MQEGALGHRTGHRDCWWPLPFVLLSLARLGTYSVLRNLLNLHHKPSEYLHFRGEKTDSRVVTCGKFTGQKSEPHLSALWTPVAEPGCT